MRLGFSTLSNNWPLRLSGTREAAIGGKDGGALLMGLDGGDPQGDGQVALADPGRAEQVDGLATVDEAELGQGEDTIAVDAGAVR